MIPNCIALLADSCYPTEKYYETFLTTDKETPKASCADGVIAGVALSIICSGSGSCYGYGVGKFTAPICIEAWQGSSLVYALPCIMLTSTTYGHENPLSPPEQPGICMTGLKRDYTVLNKTFTKPQDVLPFHQMDRTT